MPNTKQKGPRNTTPTEPWKVLGLDPALLAGVRAAKFQEPTDIQAALIPPALAGNDCIGQAKTGTGKTAAFAIPLIQQLEHGRPIQALVLVPTRELAAQVDEHVRTLSADHPAKTALVYGGRSIHDQIRRLKTGPEIVIGTPGRLLDLMRRRELDLSGVRIAVLDEVDRMLDIGFRDDIRRILRTIKSKHQTIFVSATVDEEIRRLAKTFMQEPAELNVSEDTLTVESVDLTFVTVDSHDKFATLRSFLEQEKPKLAIVFTNTKAAARRVAERLGHAGVNCKEIHGDLMQSRRERVMKSFRSAKIQVLVATDLASRGLDVMEVSHIVNYDIPEGRRRLRPSRRPHGAHGQAGLRGDVRASGGGQAAHGNREADQQGDPQARRPLDRPPSPSGARAGGRRRGAAAALRAFQRGAAPLQDAGLARPPAGEAHARQPLPLLPPPPVTRFVRAHSA